MEKALGNHETKNSAMRVDCVFEADKNPINVKRNAADNSEFKIREDDDSDNDEKDSVRNDSEIDVKNDSTGNNVSETNVDESLDKKKIMNSAGKSDSKNEVVETVDNIKTKDSAMENEYKAKPKQIHVIGDSADHDGSEIKKRKLLVTLRPRILVRMNYF